MPQKPRADKQLDRIIWDKWSAGKTADIRQADRDFVMDTMPFKGKFKRNVQDEKPFSYEAGSKSISFKPTGIWWTTPEGRVMVRSAQSATGKLSAGKVRYESAFGEGIDLELSTGKTRWRKDVVIQSLASLGHIPTNAEYLEIAFEIETDFDIEWDKEHDLQFNKAIKLDEMSRLESIKVRDSDDLFERCDGFLRAENGKHYFVKQIPVGYLRRAAYPVFTDAVIEYGSEYPFTGVAVYQTTCAALDSTHFAVCFYSASKGQAIIGVVSSGDEIAYGSAVDFNAAANTNDISCAGLDATHFVVAYEDDGGDDYSHAKIGVVSDGDAIAFGSEYTFIEAKVYTSSCAKIDATHFVVAYGGSTANCKIGTVSSGDQIAYGAQYEFESGVCNFVSCSLLDSTHFVVAFQRAASNNDGNVYIGVISSVDQIAYGSRYNFSGGGVAADNISCAGLDATHFVACFRDDGGDDYGMAKIGVVSNGDQVAYGSEYVFNETGTYPISCTRIDDTNFVVCFQDVGDANYGIAMIGVVSNGNEIAYGPEYTFNATVTDELFCAGLDATHFVVAYKDEGGDDYGHAKIGILVPIVYGAVSISAVPSMSIDGDVVASGIAAISSAPSMTVTPIRKTPGVTSISAVPSMSAAAFRKRLCVASILAVPSVSVAGDLVALGVVSINAVPSLAIDGDRTASAVAAIEVAASLSADDNFIASGIAAIAVVPSLMATGGLIAKGVASISVITSLTAVAARAIHGECSIEAVASLVALASRIRFVAASISSTTALALAAQLIASGAVDIDADASMTVDGDALRSAIASIQVTPSVAATPLRKRYGEASVDSVSSVAADGALIASGAVGIDVVSALAFIGNLIASGIVDITNVVTTTVVEGGNRRSAFCTITNTPSVTADPLRIRQGVAALEAISSLIPDGDLTASAVAAIEAVASMSVTPLRLQPGACSVDAVASLVADGGLIVRRAVAIAIVSSLAADGHLIAGGVVSIEAIASLVIAGVTVVSGAVTITAVTSLQIEALAYITQSLGYTGTLTAGDVLEINVGNMTVKLNGANARANFTGVFPLLYTETNELRWKDEDAGRDVDLEVVHKPRWV